MQSRSGFGGSSARRQRHETFFQILRIRGGEGEALFGRKSLKLTPGSIITIPPGVPHGFDLSEDMTGQAITMLATRLSARPACLMRFMTKPWLLQVGSDADSAYLMASLDQIERELALQASPRTALLEACLDVFLALAAERTAPIGQTGGASASDRLARLNTLVGAHFLEHLPAAYYADALGVSVTHLNRIARSGLGRSLNELLIDRLMTEARRSLIFSMAPIQQIAHDLGYADPAYFTRTFQRAIGETPGAFRRRERARPHIGS